MAAFDIIVQTVCVTGKGEVRERPTTGASAAGGEEANRKGSEEPLI